VSTSSLRDITDLCRLAEIVPRAKKWHACHDHRRSALRVRIKVKFGFGAAFRAGSFVALPHSLFDCRWDYQLKLNFACGGWPGIRQLHSSL